MRSGSLGIWKSGESWLSGPRAPCPLRECPPHSHPHRGPPGSLPLPGPQARWLPLPPPGRPPSCPFSELPSRQHCHLVGGTCPWQEAGPLAPCWRHLGGAGGGPRAGDTFGGQAGGPGLASCAADCFPIQAVGARVPWAPDIGALRLLEKHSTPSQASPSQDPCSRHLSSAGHGEAWAGHCGAETKDAVGPAAEMLPPGLGPAMGSCNHSFIGLFVCVCM